MGEGVDLLFDEDSFWFLPFEAKMVSLLNDRQTKNFTK